MTKQRRKTTTPEHQDSAVLLKNTTKSPEMVSEQESDQKATLKRSVLKKTVVVEPTTVESCCKHDDQNESVVDQIKNTQVDSPVPIEQATSEVASTESIDPELLAYSCDRSYVFHVLYILDSYDYDISLAAAIENINRGFEHEIPGDGLVAQHVAAIVAMRDELDKAIKPLLANWRLERVGVCTRLILRMSVWELYHCPEIDPKRTINEGIELAKCFAEHDAYKFVNGVLDEALKRIKDGSFKLSA